MDRNKGCALSGDSDTLGGLPLLFGSAMGNNSAYLDVGMVCGAALLFSLLRSGAVCRPKSKVQWAYGDAKADSQKPTPTLTPNSL